MSGRATVVLPARESEREAKQLVKISVEVHSGTTRFRVGVQAESIQQAVSLVAGRHPGRICRVKYPIEAEGFFVEGPAVRAESVEKQEELAA
jgi:hypothetical protein